MVSLSTADSYHLSRVLRKKPGYQLELVSANRVFAAELLSQGSEQEPAQVRLLQELAAYSEAPLRLILLQGLAKGERMEIVLQKAVEVEEGDTPETLQRRIMERAEWVILPQAVSLFCQGRLQVEGRTVRILKQSD